MLPMGHCSDKMLLFRDGYDCLRRMAVCLEVQYDYADSVEIMTLRDALG